MFTTVCQAIVVFNGSIKALLKVEPSVDKTEYILLDVLRDKIDFKQGDMVEVTMKKISPS
jgi:hypothetical protein